MQKARRLTGRIMNQPRTFRSGIIQTSSVSRFLFQSSSVRLPQVSGRSAATLKMIATNFYISCMFPKTNICFSPIGCKDFRPKIQLFFESTNASVQDGFTSLVRRRCRGRHICKTGCSDGASCIVYRSRCGLKVEIEIAHRFGSVGAYLDDVLCIVGSIGHHVFHDVAHKERDYEHRDSAICQR